MCLKPVIVVIVGHSVCLSAQKSLCCGLFHRTNARNVKDSMRNVLPISKSKSLKFLLSESR